jgi:hypothetical protein
MKTSTLRGNAGEELGMVIRNSGQKTADLPGRAGAGKWRPPRNADESEADQDGEADLRAGRAEESYWRFSSKEIILSVS